MRETICINDMIWEEVKNAIDSEFITVILGIGSKEQQGLHLPEKTDIEASSSYGKKYIDILSVEALKKHMKEEGENLKRLLEVQL